MRKLKALLILGFAFSFLLGAQDTSNTVRLADQSDWWSVLNENFYWPIEKPAGNELSADNFEIAGMKLDRDPSFRSVRNKFGRTVAASRGATSSARQQVCYLSEQNPPVRLIFEEGDLSLSFYLVANGQGWNGQALCAESPQVTENLRTKSGLGLGISTADVVKILGNADVSNPDRLVYEREIEQRTPNDKLTELRKEHSDMSDKDFHDNYDSYELELYIEARFTNGKVSYLAVSKTESY
jgi:hypothetical protein